MMLSLGIKKLLIICILYSGLICVRRSFPLSFKARHVLKGEDSMLWDRYIEAISVKQNWCIYCYTGPPDLQNDLRVRLTSWVKTGFLEQTWRHEISKPLTPMWFQAHKWGYTSENRRPASVWGGCFGMDRPINGVIKRAISPSVLDTFQLR